MEDKRLDEIVDALEVLDALKKLKELEKKYRKEKEEEESEKASIKNHFSKDCELYAHVVEGGENTSKAEVHFNGCEGVQDMVILGVAVMGSIVDNMPRKKAAGILATICTMALAGEEMGIIKEKVAEEEEE